MDCFYLDSSYEGFSAWIRCSSLFPHRLQTPWHAILGSWHASSHNFLVSETVRLTLHSADKLGRVSRWKKLWIGLYFLLEICMFLTFEDSVRGQRSHTFALTHTHVAPQIPKVLKMLESQSDWGRRKELAGSSRFNTVRPKCSWHSSQLTRWSYIGGQILMLIVSSINHLWKRMSHVALDVLWTKTTFHWSCRLNVSAKFWSLPC